MAKSQNSDTSNFSEYCSFESLQRRAATRNLKVKKPKNESIIDKYIRERDLPDWYRALSGLQINAADSLFDNIRDDMEQGTTYRCRRALERLGLFPLESDQNIKLCLHLCRGNDLAFLLFIMDLFYKNTCANCTHPKSPYNVNEEIIMTTISHLDMVTTLRELDILLPRLPPEIKPKPEKKIKTKVDIQISPYLRPLPKPTILKPKRMYPLIAQKVLEARYKVYNDPNYIVRNESNRWYALPEEQKVDLDFGINSADKSARIVDRILTDQIKAIFSERFNKEKIFDILCTTHTNKAKTDEHLKHIMQVAIRAQNEKHFSMEERKKLRLKKAAERLEKSAREYREHCEWEVEQIEFQTWTKNFIYDLIFESTLVEERQKYPISSPCPIYKDSDENCAERQQQHAQCECYCEESSDRYDYGHFATPKPNEIYFHAPGKNKPYKFEYDKIFADNIGESVNPIKTALRHALELDSYATEDDAIVSWIKKTWQDVVEQFNVEYEMMQCERDKEQNEEEVKTYDPRNKKLMNSLLYDAFKKMRKNPKFVFASLPDAHKHPVMTIFIKERLGYVLTKKEKIADLKKSKKILDALEKKKNNLRVPKSAIGAKGEITYLCRDYIYNKSNQIVTNFFHNLRISLLQASKVYWLAMEPFHVTQGVLRDTFYTYMPSREYDIKPFRPWKKNEYMDAKTEWIKRVKRKKAEEDARL